MADLAAFVQTPGARLYADSCREFGIDPAGFLDDDVLAVNLRVGLLWRPPKEEDPAHVVASDKAAADEARRAAKQLRAG